MNPKSLRPLAILFSSVLSGVALLSVLELVDYVRTRLQHPEDNHWGESLGEIMGLLAAAALMGVPERLLRRRWSVLPMVLWLAAAATAGWFVYLDRTNRLVEYGAWLHRNQPTSPDVPDAGALDAR